MFTTIVSIMAKLAVLPIQYRNGHFHVKPFIACQIISGVCSLYKLHRGIHFSFKQRNPWVAILTWVP